MEELELPAATLGFLPGVEVAAGFLRPCAATAAVAAAVVGERSRMSVITDVSVRRPMVEAAD